MDWPKFWMHEKSPGVAPRGSLLIYEIIRHFLGLRLRSCAFSWAEQQ